MRLADNNLKKLAMARRTGPCPETPPLPLTLTLTLPLALRLPLPLQLPLPPPYPYPNPLTPPLPPPLNPAPHQALAILLSCLASVPLFDFSPNHRFWGGAALVIVSIFLYAWAPKASPYVAVADAGGPK